MFSWPGLLSTYYPSSYFGWLFFCLFWFHFWTICKHMLSLGWPTAIYIALWLWEVGSMLRIIGNSWKNSRNNSHVCEVYKCSGGIISSRIMEFQNAVGFLFRKDSEIVKRWSQCYEKWWNRGNSQNNSKQSAFYFCQSYWVVFWHWYLLLWYFDISIMRFQFVSICFTVQKTDNRQQTNGWTQLLNSTLRMPGNKQLLLR